MVVQNTTQSMLKQQRFEVLSYSSTKHVTNPSWLVNWRITIQPYRQTSLSQSQSLMIDEDVDEVVMKCYLPSLFERYGKISFACSTLKHVNEEETSV
eukprot:scaffold33495_cov105-Skeletonema_dohrnii-CCMP3373.AAC.5